MKHFLSRGPNQAPWDRVLPAWPLVGREPRGITLLCHQETQPLCPHSIQSPLSQHVPLPSHWDLVAPWQFLIHYCQMITSPERVWTWLTTELWYRSPQNETYVVYWAPTGQSSLEVPFPLPLVLPHGPYPDLFLEGKNKAPTSPTVAY